MADMCSEFDSNPNASVIFMYSIVTIVILASDLGLEFLLQNIQPKHRINSKLRQGLSYPSVSVINSRGSGKGIAPKHRNNRAINSTDAIYQSIILLSRAALSSNILGYNDIVTFGGRSPELGSQPNPA